ncbi:hypothetical protein HJC23_001544 [Cyclotella cryptica]|uniref:DUF6816 domain-containing protein n=1 Tax=Cyclotella cryptica TaxID=29204 RepID=A0ABD3PYU6_9STRA|eukprot:CCRYP_010767-RA/>CCRYP_010767-RA protein AED:0.19 eAED:0.19 QI:0/-1/0/1/-1/1/1/0/317
MATTSAAAAALTLVATYASGVSALSPSCDDNFLVSRRQFSLDYPASAAIASVAVFSMQNADAATSIPSISNRFESEILNAPPITAGTRYSGHENLYFPDWLEGEWDAVQTLVSTKTPLGLEYIGGPQGSLDVARESMSEQKKRLNEPVNLKLRFVKTKFGVAEDRRFNMRSRLDSFAGRSVVASVEYADVRESNRASILAAGGSESDPLTTTVVYFKGPAAQKTFVISHGQEWDGGDSYVGYELDRSIFALTNTNTAPPVTSDTEILYSLKRCEDVKVEGKLRLAGYLNPQSDKLYFDAKNRAVSLNDYTLLLRRSS